MEHSVGCGCHNCLIHRAVQRGFNVDNVDFSNETEPITKTEKVVSLTEWKIKKGLLNA